MMPVLLSSKRTTFTAVVLCVVFVGFFLLLGGCGSIEPDTTSPAPTPIVLINPQTIVPSYLSDEVPSSIRFSKIDSDQDLSRSAIYAVTQDTTGFMWFGAEDGLKRYDGYTFVTFQPDEGDPYSLSDRWVTCILPVGSGNLWVGTRQGGVNYYDAGTGKFTRFLHDENNPTSLVNNRVNVLYLSNQDQLWVGTLEGLDRLDVETGEFKHYDFDIPNSPLDQSSTQMSITAILEGSGGVLWIGTNGNGLVQLDPSTDAFTVFKNDPAISQSITSDTVRGILPADNGNLWVGTDSGLELFAPSSGNFVHYKHFENDPKSLADNSIHVMALDRTGNLWLGTDAGLDVFNSRRNNFNHFSHDPRDSKSLSTNSVLAIFESRDDVLWVSTYGGYIDKYYRGMNRFTYFHSSSQNPYSISGNIVFKIYVDQQGFVWIATADGGLNRLSPSFDRFYSYQHNPNDDGSLASNAVWSVFKDSKGVLWVGTSVGLDRLNLGKGDFIHYANSDADAAHSIEGIVYDIVEDQNGDLWMGTNTGLVRYDRVNDQFIHYMHTESEPLGISDSIIVKVYIDHSNNLWIGTFMNGLDRYNLETGEFVEYRNDPDDPTTLSSDSVLSVYQDRQGRVWVGTDGGGLNLLDSASNTFVRYTDTDGLPSNVVYGILEDIAGRLWLSTNKGLSCFDPVKQTFVNYNESDGLQGNEFNMNAYAQSADGRMYFGGVNGLTSFVPLTIYASKFVPPVILLSVTQNGLHVPIEPISEGTGEITLRWPYTSFEFSFVPLSFADPAENQLAYRLLGYEDQWQDASSTREGRYTNLSGGMYTLQLKGSNEDGVWNKKGYSLIVRVIPAFWQTVWFRISLGVLVIGLIGGVFLARNASIRANTRKLEQQVAERTREIERLFEKTKELAVVEERNRLARELHDSAKQKAFAALAQLGTANGILAKNPQRAKENLREAENLVYEVIEELTFLIQEMYPLALKEKGLALTLRGYVFDWEARSGIEAFLSIENDRRLPIEMEQAVYRSIQEALSNIARHSKASSVQISVYYFENKIEAEIRDNGVGFDPLTRQMGMGLRTIRERIEALGGSVRIESAAGNGTCLSLSAPIKPHPMGEGE